MVFQETQSSPFWFQSIWGSLVTNLHLGRGLSSFRQRQMPDLLGRNKDSVLLLNCYYFSCLFAFPLFLPSLTSVQFSLVTQSCLTLCDPVDCSTPGFPVHHQFPELAQTHVHRVGGGQSFHPLSPPSPPTFSSIFPSIRVFSNQSVLRIRWPKY